MSAAFKLPGPFLRPCVLPLEGESSALAEKVSFHDAGLHGACKALLIRLAKAARSCIHPCLGPWKGLGLRGAWGGEERRPVALAYL